MANRYRFCLLLLFLSGYVQGQQQVRDHTQLTMKDGLPIDHVRSIFKDSRDNLWLSTYFGLSRYDGNVLHTYTQDNERNSICGTIITSNVLEDKQGNIWAASEHCLSSFDRQYGTWKNYECTIVQKKSSHFLRIISDGEYKIWILSNDGLLYLFDLDKRAFSRVNLPTGANPVKNIRLSSRGNLLGLYEGNKEIAISTDGKIVTDEETFTVGITLVPLDEVLSVGKDWICRNIHGIFRITRQKEIDTLQFDLNNASYPYSITRSGDKVYLVQVSNIIEYDTKTHATKTYKLALDENKAKSTGHLGVLMDSPGSLWIGTKTGLFHILLHRQDFHKLQAPRQLGNDFVRSIQLISDNELWIGSQHGPINSFQTTRLPANAPEQSVDLSPFPGVNSPINAIFRLSQEYVIVCTYSGLHAYSIQKKKYVRELPEILKQLSPEFRANVWTVLHDRKGRIWLGGPQYGLAVLDPQKNTLRYYAALDSVFNPVNACAVWSLSEDDEGNYWIGTYRGLYRGSENVDGKMTFHHYAKSATQLSGQHVWSQVQQGDYVWVGTIDGGLNRLHKPTGKIRYYTKEDGLPDISICGMQADRKGRIWLMTRKGLSCFDARQETFTNFTERDGIVHDVGAFKATAQTREGWLFFGTEKGVLYFHPDSVNVTRGLPDIGIYSFKVYEKEIRQEIMPGETIELGPDDNFFTITAGLKKIGSASGYDVYYHLKGVDDAWHRLQDNPATFSYSDLAPGRYSLLLKVTRGKGDKSLRTISINIIKQPAWHQTAGFRIPFAILLLGLIGSVPYLYFKRSALRRRLLLSEIASLRLQMNPHFIFNSLNSIQDYIIHKENHLANSYLSKFARLMRDILNNSQKRTISIEEECIFLGSYLELENLRYGDRLRYEIEMDKSVDVFDQVPPMLLQPIIENSLKHGLAPKRDGDLFLQVMITKLSKYLSVTVTDNGVGRQYSDEIRKNKPGMHISLGIQVVKDRLQVMEKITGKPYTLSIIDLYDESQKAAGTSVKLQIPI